MSTIANEQKQGLDPEFEHAAVPKEHRKSFSSVSAVWYSFPLVLTSAVIGGVVTAMLGFKIGVAAILTGNLLLCIIVGALSYLNGSGDIINFQPIAGAGALSFGAAVTMVFATFTDSGTMTADFTRWAKNGKQGFLAAFTAFPISKFFAEVIGAIIVATGVVLQPETTGGDFIMILADAGPFLSILAIIFVFINLGVGCTHCLYNGAVGWSHMTGGKMRTLTIVLGVIGIAVAISGIWNAFQTWLNLLGLIVPPIATIIIMDQLILKRKNDETKKWQPLSFIAWALGALVALTVNAYAPQLSVVVAGIVSSAIFFYIGSLFTNSTSLNESEKHA